MSATADSKTSMLCAAGLLKPEILRTNCLAAASISSGGAGSAPSLSLLMERHMVRSYSVGMRVRFNSSETRTRANAITTGIKPVASPPVRRAATKTSTTVRTRVA